MFCQQQPSLMSVRTCCQNMCSVTSHALMCVAIAAAAAPATPLLCYTWSYHVSIVLTSFMASAAAPSCCQDMLSVTLHALMCIAIAAAAATVTPLLHIISYS